MALLYGIFHLFLQLFHYTLFIFSVLLQSQMNYRF